MDQITEKDDAILQKEVLNISEAIEAFNYYEQMRICHLLTKQIQNEIRAEIDRKTDKIAELQENHQKEIEELSREQLMLKNLL